MNGFETTQDPRDLATYTLLEASNYLRIPKATLRSWVRGRAYPTKSGRRFFRPIVLLPVADSVMLSFMNLVEVHVLGAIRREHEISLPTVRNALGFLAKRFPSRHPLADERFVTDGLDLFVEKFGQLINASKDGQLAMRNLLETYLRRIERDQGGLPVRLYPFTRQPDSGELRAVVIDPYVSFGRPVLAGTNITTAVIAERFKAGESSDALAADYERPQNEIEEAIRCELPLEAA